jgi:tetratricopeptide (TPR) repeat protein
MRPALLLLALLVLGGCSSAAPLPPKALELNRDGAAALAAGDLDTAGARLSVALEYNPRFTEAWVNLGLVELRRGNFEKARKHFEKARSLNRDLPTPHHQLGYLEDLLGKGDEAEKHYKEALKVDPGFAPARINLARRFYRRGAHDEAREQFLRLTQVAPEEMDGWVGLSESLVALRRFKEADEVLTQTRSAWPEEPAVLLLTARQQLRAEDFNAAEKTLLPLTGAPDRPRAASAWAWLAMTKLGKGEVDAAVEAAKHALAIDRDEAVATYAMGQALLARGDAGAQAWLDKAEQMKRAR